MDLHVLFVICLMDVLFCNGMDDIFDLDLRIDVYGIREYVNMPPMLLSCNHTKYRINIEITQHDNAEEFSFYTAESKSNDTFDVLCMDELTQFSLPNGFASLSLGPVSCFTLEVYKKYLHNYEKRQTLSATDFFRQTVYTLGWKCLVLFYENSSDLFVNRIVEGLAKSDVEVLLANVDDLSDNDLLNYLSKVVQITKNMSLICSYECTERVMTLVNHLHIINGENGAIIPHRTFWIIFSRDQNVSQMLTTVAANVTNVALITHSYCYFEKCHKEQPMCLDKIVGEITGMSEDINIHNTVKAASILFISKMFTSENHLLTLIFNKDGRQFIDTGTSYNKSKFCIKNDVFPNVHFGFNQRVLLVSTLEWQPYNKRLANGTYIGFTMRILDKLSDTFNFTYKIVEPDDGEWGVLKNGKWSGMIGLLDTKKVDMVAAPLTVTFERSQAVNFLHPMFFDANKLVIKRPNQDENKWRTLIDIYSFIVMILMAVCFIFSTFFLYIVEKVNPYYKLETNRQKVRLNSISDCFWYTYGALLTQGGTNTPDAQTGRTVLSYWWIFCIVSMAIYTGNLVAFLTVTDNRIPFTTMEEMVKQTKYKWGLYGGGAMEMFLSGSPLQVHQTAWNGIVQFNQSDKSVLSSSEDVQFQKVLNEHYAYFSTNGVTKYFQAKGMDLVIIPETISAIQNSFAVQKNSYYEEMFSKEIMRMHESGLLIYWLQEAYPKNATITKSSRINATPITLSDVQSAFYLVGIGVACGFVSWIMENIFHKLWNCRGQTKTNDVKLNRMQSFNDLTLE